MAKDKEAYSSDTLERSNLSSLQSDLGNKKSSESNSANVNLNKIQSKSSTICIYTLFHFFKCFFIFFINGVIFLPRLLLSTTYLWQHKVRSLSLIERQLEWNSASSSMSLSTIPNVSLINTCMIFFKTLKHFSPTIRLIYVIWLETSATFKSKMVNIFTCQLTSWINCIRFQRYFRKYQEGMATVQLEMAPAKLREQKG